jgi:predicted HTH domain antitoxin
MNWVSGGEKLLFREVDDVLQLYRERKISIGKAAEMSGMSIEAFMVFSGKHGVPIHYGISDLEEDRETLERLCRQSSD